MTTTFNNYLCHTNTWYWGTSIKIVHKKGIGIICVKLDDDYPSTAFICDLSVFELNRKQGIGRELMKSALAVARKHGKSYAELYVDKEKDWLVAWYSSFGFEIVRIDAHEYTMLKHLEDDKDDIKQYLAKEMAKS